MSPSIFFFQTHVNKLEAKHKFLSRTKTETIRRQNKQN